MNRIIRFRRIFGLWSLTMIASYFLQLSSGCKSSSTSNSKPSIKRAVPVAVDSVKRGTLRMTLRYPGELIAPRSVEIASEIGGRIKNINVRMGEYIKPGQLLIIIDDAQLQSQLQEAQAALDVARSSLRRAAVEDHNAAVELTRKKPLAKRDLISKQEMDNVTSRRETAAASLAVAKAQVSQSEARVSLLAQQVRDSRIHAPFAGWIQKRHLDPGAVVNSGAAILQLVQTDPIVAQFKIGERHIGEVRRLMRDSELKVTLSVDTYPQKRFSGKVVRVAPALDVASRTVAVEAELENREGKLMPGMFCRVEIFLGSRENALLVPLRALLEQEKAQAHSKKSQGIIAQDAVLRQRVFVAKNGVAKVRSVRLGVEDGQRGEVLEGLKAGDLVIVDGQDSLEDGAKVNVVEAPDNEREPPEVHR